jgi:hypothetical protein
MKESFLLSGSPLLGSPFQSQKGEIAELDNPGDCVGDDQVTLCHKNPSAEPA